MSNRKEGKNEQNSKTKKDEHQPVNNVSREARLLVKDKESREEEKRELLKNIQDMERKITTKEDRIDRLDAANKSRDLKTKNSLKGGKEMQADIDKKLDKYAELMSENEDLSKARQRIEKKVHATREDLYSARDKNIVLHDKIFNAEQAANHKTKDQKKSVTRLLKSKNDEIVALKDDIKYYEKKTADICQLLKSQKYRC